MKYQILLSGENKKNLSICRLLKILPSMLNVKTFFLSGCGKKFLEGIYITIPSVL